MSRAVGIQPKDIFRPHLDIKSIDVNAGALSLHDGDIPIRLSGSGTRRLITLALQKEIVSGGSVALIDEVEIGLEPHRLRRLIRSLREDSAGPLGQIFMTTHSSVVVDELPCTELRVVRVRDGDVTVQAIDEKSQKTVRRSPEVFLSSAIVVCEGITEVGFCKALDAWWLKSGNYDPLAVKGISLVDGNGVAAEPYAKAIAGIGYTTAFFADSDRPLNPSRLVLEASGVTVILWGDSLCLEQRVAADLPWDGVQQLLTLAATFTTEDAVRSGVCGAFPLDKTILKSPISNWPDTDDLRKAIGLAAKQGGWFKQMDRGEQLGNVVVTHLSKISTRDLAKQIAALRAWIDSNG